MRYTNTYGIPDAIVKAIEADPYSKGQADFSATELLKPPQIVRLYKEHEHELTEDVSDAIWRLLGSGVHSVLESAYTQSYGVTEARLFGSVAGKVISGSPDIREPGKITDYKVTSTYKIIANDLDDWEAQLNIYDWLCWKNDIDGDRKLEIVAILRDWKKSQRWKDNYPQVPVKIIPIHKWSHAKQEQFIKSKIEDHMAETPRECTREETWNGIRCRDWCPVSAFCKQHQAVK